MTKTSAESRYKKLAAKRQQFVRRAYECAKLTIPSLVPFENESNVGSNVDTSVEQPWQSLGSVGVNTLTAKLVLTLLPANSPFFQLTMSRETRAQLLGVDEEQADAATAAIDQKLQALEHEIVADMETSPMRGLLFPALKHLLVAGNYLLYLGDELKGFPLYRYVTRRSVSGDVLELIVHEVTARENLPEDFIKSISGRGKKKLDENVDIYTVVKRKPGKGWDTYQECSGEEVPGTRGTFTDENNPWLPLRMITIENEDYGRSYCEELYGDLQTAESLSKAIAQGGMIASKLLWLINPNGVTDVDDVLDSANGDAIPGRQEDVGVLRAEKLADFQVAERVLTAVAQRLERSFLLHSAVQRDAERVTAFEISMMTQEIEDVMGGYYALLSKELQLPLVRIWMDRMQRTGKIPMLPSGSVEPLIVTGVDALGRGQDLTRQIGRAHV